MARPQGITKFSIPVVNVSKLIPPIETDNYHLVLDLVLKLDISDSERYKAYKNLDSEQYLSNTFTDNWGINLDHICIISEGLQGDRKKFQCF